MSEAGRQGAIMQLKAEKVSFRYSSKSRYILKNADFTLNSGERIALIGPSGYGKSTFAGILAGYIRPDSGRVTMDGKEFEKNRLCPVQLIYQHPEKAINPRWKMKKVLEEAGQFTGESLGRFGIEKEWLERFPAELSGGELQRFCVARALLSGADMIIADEMSTMLDAVTQAQIWNVLLRESEERGIGLLAVTHNIKLAEHVCETIIDLRDLNDSGAQSSASEQ